MPSPYYQDDLVTLFHGDCRDITEWLAADVLVTDPPYGTGRDHRMGRTGKTITGEVVRTLSSDRQVGPEHVELRGQSLALWGTQRPALVFGGWRAPRPAGTRARLIWDKCLPSGGSLKLPWGQCDEEVYVLGDWPPITPGGRAREGGTPARGSNVLRVQGYAPGSKARPDHPTPKPVPLLVQLIERCPPGAIADPFAGSGATLLAARQLGRRVVGVEVEERYCELIAERLTGGRTWSRTSPRSPTPWNAPPTASHGRWSSDGARSQTDSPQLSPHLMASWPTALRCATAAPDRPWP